ncbi:MAG TPA: universal stress protein [Gaiellaceae bacterium]|jgi:nucleotide-binding universal stress UspA family protein|nr:universal stress protein [Gaiellaceae bacterium]
METILAGYDGTRSAEQALTRSAELAKAFGSRVVVVSVASPEPVAAGGAFGLSPYYYAAVAGQTGLRTDEAIWEQHRERVESFFASRGVPVEFEGVLGRPADEIVLLAEQERADLIVVGTREPGFVERLLGGSVSQGVARRARCDVLIVHPPEDD